MCIRGQKWNKLISINSFDGLTFVSFIHLHFRESWALIYWKMLFRRTHLYFVSFPLDTSVLSLHFLFLSPPPPLPLLPQGGGKPKQLVLLPPFPPLLSYDPQLVPKHHLSCPQHPHAHFLLLCADRWGFTNAHTHTHKQWWTLNSPSSPSRFDPVQLHLCPHGLHPLAHLLPGRHLLLGDSGSAAGHRTHGPGARRADQALQQGTPQSGRLGEQPWTPTGEEEAMIAARNWTLPF